MDCSVFTPPEVRAVILNSKNSSSCGPDDCSTKFLKLFFELSVFLVQIFNISLCQHFIHKSWKLSNVIPIYKGKESKLDIEKYRPISLTNIYCKIMETLLCNKISEYLDANKLFSSYQYVWF